MPRGVAEEQKTGAKRKERSRAPLLVPYGFGDTYPMGVLRVAHEPAAYARFTPDQSGVIRADASGSGASVNSTPIG